MRITTLSLCLILTSCPLVQIDGEESMFNPTAPFVILHLVAETGENVLFSPSGGGSAPGDTPPSTPFRPYLKTTGNPVDWKAGETSGGWIDMGGVVDWKETRFTMVNTKNPDTHQRPLDDLVGLRFQDQDAIWYAAQWVSTGDWWEVPTLAGSQVIGRGTVISAKFGNDIPIVRVREITKQTLRVPTTPIQFFGRGGGVHVETGGTPTTGARISRPDHVGIRGTGDQWFSWTGSVFETAAASPANFNVIVSPIFRLRCNPSLNTIAPQLRDAAGAWNNIGTPPTYTDLVADTFSTLVNYEVATTTAELFVNGTVDGKTVMVSAGSTVLTGGLFVAAPGTTTFQNDAAPGDVTFTHWFFRHGARLLDADELDDRGLYTFDFFNEAALTCALEMGERVEASIQDTAGNVSATLEGFADTDAAWRASHTGEASQSHVRPLARIGKPFNAKLNILDAAFGIVQSGYEGKLMERRARAVLGDGARISSEIVQSLAVSTTFTAANFQTSFLPVEKEPAAGQEVTFDTGANAGVKLSVGSLMLDPLVGSRAIFLPGEIGAPATLLGVIIDDTAAGLWTGKPEDVQWVTAPSPESLEIQAAFGDAQSVNEDYRSLFLSMLIGLTTNVSAPVDDASGFLVANFLQLLGPEQAPVDKFLAETNLAFSGWQGEGSRESGKVADELAKQTPSLDYGPSVVWTRMSDATVRVTGLDNDASTPAVFAFGESRIKSADPAAFESKYGAVRVRYGRNYGFKQGEELRTLTTATRDALAMAVASEWREVTAGTGSTELVLETAFLRSTEAQLYADAFLKILERGEVYKVEIHGPLSPAEVAMEPFAVIDITWSPDALLAGGKKGSLVGLKVNSKWEGSLLIYFEN